MKKMKLKTSVVLLLLALCFSFTGCASIMQSIANAETSAKEDTKESKEDDDDDSDEEDSKEDPKEDSDEKESEEDDADVEESEEDDADVEESEEDDADVEESEEDDADVITGDDFDYDVFEDSDDYGYDIPDDLDIYTYDIDETIETSFFYMRINEATFTDTLDGEAAPDGYQFVILNVSLKAFDSTPVDMYYSDFDLEWEDDYCYPLETGWTDDQLADEYLITDETTTGDLVFYAPADADEVVLSYLDYYFYDDDDQIYFTGYYDYHIATENWSR